MKDPIESLVAGELNVNGKRIPLSDLNSSQSTPKVESFQQEVEMNSSKSEPSNSAQAHPLENVNINILWSNDGLTIKLSNISPPTKVVTASETLKSEEEKEENSQTVESKTATTQLSENNGSDFRVEEEKDNKSTSLTNELSDGFESKEPDQDSKQAGLNEELFKQVLSQTKSRYPELQPETLHLAATALYNRKIRDNQGGR